MRAVEEHWLIQGEYEGKTRFMRTTSDKLRVYATKATAKAQLARLQKKCGRGGGPKEHYRLYAIYY
jgi:hypothetical protein